MSGGWAPARCPARSCWRACCGSGNSASDAAIEPQSHRPLADRAGGQRRVPVAGVPCRQPCRGVAGDPRRRPELSAARHRLHHERVGLRDLVRYVAERNLGALGRYLWERVRTPEAARALGTLVIERLFDLFAVVLLLTVVLPLFPGLSSWIKIFDGIAAVVAFAVLAVVYVISRRTEQLAEPRWVTGRRPLEIGFRLLLQVMKGFSAVRDPRRALVLLVLSAALWLSQTGTYAIAFSAVHIPLGWKEGALTTAVLALTAIIPTGPGFAGSFELATQQLLALFAVDRTLATGYQEYTRLINLIASVIYLVVCLAALKLWPSREPRPSAQTAPAFD